MSHNDIVSLRQFKIYDDGSTLTFNDFCDDLDENHKTNNYTAAKILISQAATELKLYHNFPAEMVREITSFLKPRDVDSMQQLFTKIGYKRRRF